MRSALLIAVLPLAALSARADSEFHYKIPDGWVDLRSSNTIADNIPQSVVAEAASGKYAVYAVDPARATRQGCPVSVNVVEGTPTGRVTLGAVRQGAVEMSQHLNGMGATVNLEEMKVTKLDDVDIGVVQSSVETPRGELRMLQYMIPGKTKVAVLTYVCPLIDSAHYTPIFESSAMATTGAYNHAGFGSGFASGFNWNRVWISGAVAAVVAVIVVLITGSRNKPKTAPMPLPSTPMVWDCPTCKRRVPVRVNQCRCGTPQPA